MDIGPYGTMPAKRYLARLSFGLRGGPLRHSYRFIGDPMEIQTLLFQAWKQKSRLGIQIKGAKVWRSRLLSTRKQVRAQARDIRIVLDPDLVA